MVGCQESCSLEDQWGLMGRAKGHGSPAKRARTGRGLPGASPTEKGSRLGMGGIRAILGAGTHTSAEAQGASESW